MGRISGRQRDCGRVWGGSEVGQWWDSQGGRGTHWGGRGSQPDENFGSWLVGPGNLGTPVRSIQRHFGFCLSQMSTCKSP